MKTYREVVEVVATKIADYNDRQMAKKLETMEKVADALDIFKYIAIGAARGAKNAAEFQKTLGSRAHAMNKRFYVALLTADTQELKDCLIDAMNVGLQEGLRRQGAATHQDVEEALSAFDMN